MLKIYKSTKTPNVKTLINGQKVAFYNKYYHNYSQSLVLTNELSQIANLKDHINKNTKILTVLGSGEQPLFFKIYGAKDIFTFYISFTSYLLASLKISAIQVLQTSDEYNVFINDLFTLKTIDELLKKTYLSMAVKNLSKENQFYLQQTIKYKSTPFYRNSSCNLYSVNPEEFDILKRFSETDTPFIWTDISKLFKGIYHEKFDIIYYSNILSFKHESMLRPVLESAKQHLSSNGKIFLTSEPFKTDQIQSAISDVFRTGYDTQLFEQQEYFHQIMIQHIH